MKQIHDIEILNLIDKAKIAMERAYSPYSHFTVGVCLKGATGAYYPGANIENASYSATLCAERVALSRAVYEGERDFDAVAIVTDSEDIATPCGICCQVLSEFCDLQMPVICANTQGKYKVFAFEELFPMPFKMEK